jgi:hypothetical protein
VVITGSLFDLPLSEAAFAFAFANQNFDEGTASAAFTSWAVPEPSALALVGLAMAAVIGRRHR